MTVLIPQLFRVFFFRWLKCWVKWYVYVMYYYLKKYCFEFLENIYVCLNKWIYRRDLKRANLNNGLVKPFGHKQFRNFYHNFNFKDYKMLICIHDEKTPKIVESCIISNLFGYIYIYYLNNTGDAISIF